MSFQPGIAVRLAWMVSAVKYLSPVTRLGLVDSSLVTRQGLVNSFPVTRQGLVNSFPVTRLVISFLNYSTFEKAYIPSSGEYMKKNILLFCSSQIRCFFRIITEIPFTDSSP